MVSESIFKKTVWLVVFSIAMGFLESAVVIYLRELYYPSGFNFPLQIIPDKIALVELCRETATIIMLAGVACLSGTTKLTRFSFFLIAFAVWDLCYYLFLFLFIAWPQSWFTWDILFLIPFPWTGPVIAPCLVAFGMIVFAGFILYASSKKEIKITTLQWWLLLTGCTIIIFSFMYDYFKVVRIDSVSAFPSKEGLLHELKHYIPNRFNWPLFISGFITSVTGVLLFIKKQLLIKK